MKFASPGVSPRTAGFDDSPWGFQQDLAFHVFRKKVSNGAIRGGLLLLESGLLGSQGPGHGRDVVRFILPSALPQPNVT
jgi:hypothetical protein